MLYCNVIDGEIKTVPRTLPSDLVGKTEEELNAAGWFRGFFVNLPHMLSLNVVTQIARMNMTLVGNVVQCEYVVVDKSPEDIAATEELLMKQVRAERFQKLLHSDWTQLPNAPLTTEKKSEWETYRQVLRDFPNTVQLDNIIWPVEPTI